MKTVLVVAEGDNWVCLERRPSIQIWTTVGARRANQRGKHRARVRQSSRAREHGSAQRVRGLL